MKHMKRSFLLFFTLFSFVAVGNGQNKEKQVLSLVPKPNEVIQKKGTFTVNSKTAFVVTNNETLRSAAELVNSRFKNAAGFEMKMTSGKRKKNFIAVELNSDTSMGAEEYSLDVTRKGATIKASSERGAFYGLMTLLQLLPPEIESATKVADVKWTVPCVSIKDKPRFVWRGMHLDVCRHFVGVDFIKKQLDVMSLFKMNTFHWHLTEDQGWRIEIKKYPKLTTIGSKRMEGEGHEYGGFYTQEEVKEVVAYAKARFINVVPEIELPGHALGALTAYPNLSCTGGPFKIRNVWGVEPDVYCAGKEEVFAFLEDVIKEVVALFPYEYFHIGGDECPKARWKECPLCQKRMKEEGLKNEHQLQSYFVQRIEKVLESYGKKMIGWDEILEGGLAQNASVMSWRGEKGGIEAAQQGHDVVMTPGNWVYLDHYQGSSNVEPVAIGGYTTLEESYGYDPVPKKLDKDKAKHILGTQGNVWSEYMYTPELFEHRIYPRIIALAEVGWTEKKNKNFENFVKRMDEQFVRLDHHNINYHIPLPEGPTNNVAFTDKAKLVFTTTRPIKMVYTLDGSEPQADSKEYSSPLNFTKNATVKIRTVLASGKMSKVRTIKVERQKFLAPVSASTVGNGLKMRAAKGAFVKVEDLKKVSAWNETVVTSFDKLFSKDKPSAAIFNGYIEIPEDGVYEFATNVDQFFLGGKLLVDNNGEVKRFSRNNATIALAKGKHEVKILFLNNIIGGWPQAWSGPKVSLRKMGDKKFNPVTMKMYSYK